MMTGFRHRSVVIGAFALIYLVWGSTYLAVALALGSIPPFLLMGSRSVVAGLVLFAAARWYEGTTQSWQAWMRAALCGFLFFVTCHGTLAYAQQHVPSGIAAILLATIPFWIALLTAIIPDGDTQHPKQLLLPVPGFIGVVVVVLGQAGLASSSSEPGDLFLLIGAAASWALGTILARRWSPPDATVAYSGMELMTGGVVLLIISALLDEPASLDIGAISPAAWGGWVYLTVAGTIVTFSAYVWLLKRVSPTLVATYTFVNPVIAVVLGWAILGETLSGAIVLGVALIIACVIGLLATGSGHRSATSSSTASFDGHDGSTKVKIGIEPRFRSCCRGLRFDYAPRR
jgi:drug/metabolite transporter (DMT)-like permease